VCVCEFQTTTATEIFSYLEEYEVRNRKIENSIRYWIVYCTVLYTIFSPISSNVYVLYAVWFERTEKPIIIVKHGGREEER